MAFGLIGFLDDYLKVVLKRSDGLMPMQKMALQIIVTAVFAFYLVKVADIPLTMLVPFSNGYYLDIGWMAVPLLFVAVIGTVNGTNFTDGTGWPCFQCDRSCRNIFYSCGDRNEKRDRTCHLCCSRGAAWIFTV